MDNTPITFMVCMGFWSMSVFAMVEKRHTICLVCLVLCCLTIILG
jgi:hypothetical protein